MCYRIWQMLRRWRTEKMGSNGLCMIPNGLEFSKYQNRVTELTQASAASSHASVDRRQKSKILQLLPVSEFPYPTSYRVTTIKMTF
jgi:hypothetical protein